MDRTCLRTEPRPGSGRGVEEVRPKQAGMVPAAEGSGGAQEGSEAEGCWAGCWPPSTATGPAQGHQGRRPWLPGLLGRPTLIFFARPRPRFSTSSVDRLRAAVSFPCGRTDGSFKSCLQVDTEWARGGGSGDGGASSCAELLGCCRRCWNLSLGLRMLRS